MLASRSTRATVYPFPKRRFWVDKFGSLAKLREVLRLAEAHKISDPHHMVEVILDRASRKRSTSPFRHPIKDARGNLSYPVCSSTAVTSHVAYADWLDLVVYRDANQGVLAGFDREPVHFSNSVLNEAILKRLGKGGLSELALIDAVQRLDVADLDTVVASLRRTEGADVGLTYLRKSLRLLGELAITLKANRKRTLHPAS